jgi:hypothetical protein
MVGWDVVELRGGREAMSRPGGRAVVGVEADEVEPWFVLLRGMENDPMESDVGISPPFFFPSPSSSASPSFVDSSGVPFLRASLSLISRLNF